MVKKRKLTLITTHHVFLTKEERRDLISLKPINVTGISLPVWFDGESGNTTEPATEVFCNYKLQANSKVPIVEKTKKGYKINIPIAESKTEEISNEKWRTMTLEEQEKWYTDRPSSISVNNLKDIGDGGAEYLRLEELKKRSPVTLIHSIEIKTIESLEGSLVTESTL